MMKRSLDVWKLAVEGCFASGRLETLAREAGARQGDLPNSREAAVLDAKHPSTANLQPSKLPMMMRRGRRPRRAPGAALPVLAHLCARLAFLLLLALLPVSSAEAEGAQATELGVAARQVAQPPVSAGQPEPLASSRLGNGLAFRWAPELSRAEPYEAQAFHGETFRLAATPRQYGQPLIGLSGAAAKLYWQTPGMEPTKWYVAPGEYDPATGTLTATWTPAMDVGGDRVTFFLALEQGDAVAYRVHGRLRLAASPGFNPATLVPEDVRQELVDAIAAEVKDWADGAFAAKEHTHAAADIVSGKFAIDRLPATNGYASGAKDETLVPTKKALVDALADIRQWSAGRYLTAEADPTVPAWAKAPAKPTYTWAEILGRPTSWAWEAITGKPTVYPPAEHTHAIADIEGLREGLDGMVSRTGTNALSDPIRLINKSPSDGTQRPIFRLGSQFTNGANTGDTMREDRWMADLLYDRIRFLTTPGSAARELLFEGGQAGSLVRKDELDTALDGKQTALEWDAAPTEGSQKSVRSGGIWSWVVNALKPYIPKSGGTVNGPLRMENPAVAVDAEDATKDVKLVPLAEGAGLQVQFPGGKTLLLRGNTSGSAATVGELNSVGNQIVDQVNTALGGYLPLTGGTVTGHLDAFNLSVRDTLRVRNVDIRATLLKKQDQLVQGDGITLEPQDDGKVKVSAAGYTLPNDVLTNGSFYYDRALSVGNGASAGNYGTAVGNSAYASDDATAIGQGAEAARYEIMIKAGSSSLKVDGTGLTVNGEAISGGMADLPANVAKFSQTYSDEVKIEDASGGYLSLLPADRALLGRWDTLEVGLRGTSTAENPMSLDIPTQIGMERYVGNAVANAYTLPAATASTLGGVKVGSGLSITSDGTLSAAATPITVDAALSATSTNPLQNKVISKYLDSPGVVLGKNASASMGWSAGQVAIGNNASVGGGSGVAIGSGATTADTGTALGAQTSAGANGLALGAGNKTVSAAANEIVLAAGSDSEVPPGDIVTKVELRLSASGGLTLTMGGETVTFTMAELKALKQ